MWDNTETAGYERSSQTAFIKDVKTEKAQIFYAKTENPFEKIPKTAVEPESKIDAPE